MESEEDNKNEPKQTSLLADDEMRAELLAAFKSELDEYLESLNRNLIKLEQGGVQESVLQEIFRTAHSMKGTAGAFGLSQIQKISHSMENLFGAIRRNEYVPERAAFDACYEGLDAINRLMEMELSGHRPPAGMEEEFASKIEQLLKPPKSSKKKSAAPAQPAPPPA